MGVALNTIVPNAVRTAFSNFEQIVRVVVVERKRASTANKPEPSTASFEIDPITGFSTAARNTFDSNTRSVIRQEDKNIANTLTEIDPVPAASPTPLPNTPSGMVRFSLNGLVLTPKVNYMTGEREADLKVLFEINRLPMLDGRRFIPDAGDFVLADGVIYTIKTSSADPTKSLATAMLMRSAVGGDFTDGN